MLQENWSFPVAVTCAMHVESMPKHKGRHYKGTHVVIVGFTLCRYEGGADTRERFGLALGDILADFYLAHYPA